MVKKIAIIFLKRHKTLWHVYKEIRSCFKLEFYSTDLYSLFLVLESIKMKLTVYWRRKLYEPVTCLFALRSNLRPFSGSLHFPGPLSNWLLATFKAVKHCQEIGGWVLGRWQDTYPQLTLLWVVWVVPAPTDQTWPGSLGFWALITALYLCISSTSSESSFLV